MVTHEPDVAARTKRSIHLMDGEWFRMSGIERGVILTTTARRVKSGHDRCFLFGFARFS